MLSRVSTSYRCKSMTLIKIIININYSVLELTLITWSEKLEILNDNTLTDLFHVGQAPILSETSRIFGAVPFHLNARECKGKGT